MIRLALFFNFIILLVLWSICCIAVTPAYNHFIQYGEFGGVLPSYTAFAIENRFRAIILPLFWGVVSFWVYRKTRVKESAKKMECILLFVLFSIASEIIMLSYYLLAAIMPYLEIGVAL